MGIDLVPKVSSFFIVELEFVKYEHWDPNNPNQVQDWSPELGCVSEGMHRVLRFNLDTYNQGDKAFVLGNPQEKQDIFTHPQNPAGPINWIMKDKFMTYSLKDDNGNEFKGYKQPYCIKSGKDDNGKLFSCSYQGIGMGTADPYDAPNPCQFIVIDGLEDGDYTFEAIVNATSVSLSKENPEKILFKEDRYDNNNAIFRLRFKGNEQPKILSSNQLALLPKR